MLTLPIAWVRVSSGDVLKSCRKPSKAAFVTQGQRMTCLRVATGEGHTYSTESGSSPAPCTVEAPWLRFVRLDFDVAGCLGMGEECKMQNAECRKVGWSRNLKAVQGGELRRSQCGGWGAALGPGPGVARCDA